MGRGHKSALSQSGTLGSFRVCGKGMQTKLRHLYDLLIKKEHFDEVMAHAHVTEFQKWGLSHEDFPLLMVSKIS
jgi:hypothetical protein